MRVELWPISRPKPYPNNPRRNAQAVSKVAASIQEFGFAQPIVCDADDVIIIGHTRFEAAKRLGLEEVPVQVERDLTPDQVRALRIADNRTHEEAEWDTELLKLEIEDLKLDEGNTPLLAISFDPEELAALEPDLSARGESARENEGDASDSPAGTPVAVPKFFLSWAATRTEISEDDVDRLNTAFEAYLETHGLAYGFVRSLLVPDANDC
jgi:ParB-like chromosome segregation protein Spo0J